MALRVSRVGGAALVAGALVAVAGAAGRRAPVVGLELAPVAREPAVMRAVTAEIEAGPAPALGPRWLPVPPAQDDPWEPPASELPPHVVSAFRLLFEQGLADPRGCPYRRVTIGVCSVLASGTNSLETRGWVLPGGRFAIAWNGLVYPVESVGRRADLAADVRRMLRVAAAARERGWEHFWLYWADGEAVSLSRESLLPTRAALLLRLGEGELAVRVWQSWVAGLAGGSSVELAQREPYFPLVSDLAWSLFERAVLAHAGGDDVMALESAEALLPLPGRTLEALAERALGRSARRGPAREGRARAAQAVLSLVEACVRLLDKAIGGLVGPRLLVARHNLVHEVPEGMSRTSTWSCRRRRAAVADSVGGT